MTEPKELIRIEKELSKDAYKMDVSKMKNANLPIGDIDLPSLPCPKCGTRMEWKIVKNVAWARRPYRYQPYCPNCKKMRKKRINIPLSV